MNNPVDFDLVSLARYDIANDISANSLHAQDLVKCLQLKLHGAGFPTPDLIFPEIYDPESDQIPDSKTVVKWCVFIINSLTEFDPCTFESWSFERLYWILHHAIENLLANPPQLFIVMGNSYIEDCSSSFEGAYRSLKKAQDRIQELIRDHWKKEPESFICVYSKEKGQPRPSSLPKDVVEEWTDEETTSFFISVTKD